MLWRPYLTSEDYQICFQSDLQYKQQKNMGYSHVFPHFAIFKNHLKSNHYQKPQSHYLKYKPLSCCTAYTIFQVYKVIIFFVFKGSQYFLCFQNGGRKTRFQRFLPQRYSQQRYEFSLRKLYRTRLFHLLYINPQVYQKVN